MADKIQMRRDTAANWTSQNPTLSAGEIGFENDTGELKIGDGSTAWTSLEYFRPGGSYMEAYHVQTSNRTLTSGTENDMAFDSANGDTLGITPGTGNRTIPAAFNGWRMRLIGQVDFSNGTALGVITRLYHNGTRIAEFNASGNYTQSGRQATSRWVTVSTSDTFKMTVYPNSGADTNASFTWMQIEFRRPAP